MTQYSGKHIDCIKLDSVNPWFDSKFLDTTKVLFWGDSLISSFEVDFLELWKYLYSSVISFYMLQVSLISYMGVN